MMWRLDDEQKVTKHYEENRKGVYHPTNIYTKLEGSLIFSQVQKNGCTARGFSGKNCGGYRTSDNRVFGVWISQCDYTVQKLFQIYTIQHKFWKARVPFQVFQIQRTTNLQKKKKCHKFKHWSGFRKFRYKQFKLETPSCCCRRQKSLYNVHF